MLYTNLPLLDTYASRIVGGYLAHSIANFSAPHYNQQLSRSLCLRMQSAEQPSAVYVIAVSVPRQLGDNVESLKNKVFPLNGGWLAMQNVPTCVESGSQILAGGGNESGTHDYAPRPVRLMPFLPHLALRPTKNNNFTFSPSFHSGMYCSAF